MKRQPTSLPGVYHITLDVISDDRGAFARTWCEDTAVGWGEPKTHWIQESLSFNKRAGTLRGLHFQTGDQAETKLVQCLRGALVDVVLDLRPQSPTFGQWTSVRLDGETCGMVWIPKGCAHGFQTLAEDTLMLYRMDTPYAPESASGLKWDDPDLAIDWPLPVSAISERDQAWSSFALFRQGLDEGLA